MDITPFIPSGAPSLTTVIVLSTGICGLLGALRSAEAILLQTRTSGVICLHLVKWGPLGTLGRPTWVRLHVGGRAPAVAWVLRELHALRRKEHSAR